MSLYKFFRGLTSLAVNAGAILLLGAPALFGFNRAIMEGLPASNNAIFVSTGSSPATSQVTVQNLAVDQLPANQCVQTIASSGHTLFTTSGGQCGTGGGGGGGGSGSSVTVTLNGASNTVVAGATVINFSSDFTASLTGGATANIALLPGGASIRNSAVHQAGAVFNVDSGTINGPFQVLVSTTLDQRIDAIEAPGFYVNVTTAISNDSGAQSEAIYAKIHNTSPSSTPAVDAIAVHGRAVDSASSNGQLIGIMGEVFGQNDAPAYTGLWGTAGWASDLAQGTTSEIEGLRLIAQITNLAGNVTRSTGTLKMLYIPDFTNGSGAPNQSWPIYVAAPYPSFFNGFIGIGQKLPASPLTVVVNTNTQWGIVMGTSPVGNTVDISTTNYTFMVTNPGIIYSRGFVMSGNSSLNASQNPGGTPDAFISTYKQALSGSERMTAMNGQVTNTSTNSGTLSVAVGVQAVSTDSGTLGVNGTLEGMDARAQGTGYGAQYAGLVAHGNWDSPQVGGTTSTIVGVQIVNSITAGDGSTPLSTGTLKQLYISDPTGSGAANQSWAIYSVSRFPSYFNNFIGIGDKAPVAVFSVAATTNTTYAIAAGSVPFYTGTFPTSNYMFTVTNSGVVQAQKLSLNGATGATLSIHTNTTNEIFDIDQNQTGAGLEADIGFQSQGTTVGTMGWTFHGSAGSENGFAFHDLNGNEVARIEGVSNDRFQLGTTTGTNKVNINGSASIGTADPAPPSGLLVAGSVALRSQLTSASSATVTGLSISGAGHLNTRTTTPSLSSCGATPSLGAGSSDNAGKFTEGTGSPTGCTVTFGVAFGNTPFCVAQTTSTATTAAVTAISNSQFTVTTSVSIPADTISYVCVGSD